MMVRSGGYSLETDQASEIEAIMQSASALKQEKLDCIDCEHRTLRTFCNLDKAALRVYASIGIEVCFPKGEILFHENERSHN